MHHVEQGCLFCKDLVWVQVFDPIKQEPCLIPPVYSAELSINSGVASTWLEWKLAPQQPVPNKTGRLWRSVKVSIWCSVLIIFSGSCGKLLYQALWFWLGRGIWPNIIRCTMAKLIDACWTTTFSKTLLTAIIWKKEKKQGWEVNKEFKLITAVTHL